jgi:hypothetical protein
LYSQERFHENLLSEVGSYLGPQPLKECLIEFGQAISYPNVWSLRVFAPRAGDIIRQDLDGEWSAYNRVIADLGGLSEDCSYIGGYPTWDQEHESYAPLEFLATVASESKAHLMFGDCGHANLFITTSGDEVPLIIVQCG